MIRDSYRLQLCIGYTGNGMSASLLVYLLSGNIVSGGCFVSCIFGKFSSLFGVLLYVLFIVIMNDFDLVFHLRAVLITP